VTATEKQNLVAQWAFDTRPVLLRFHLWLEDVKVEYERGERLPGEGIATFVPRGIRRCLAITAGVTALGTKLFARFGGGAGADKQTFNLVKKEADAISAYVMSEGLWHFTRGLPENHAIMVCLGEGLMPKGGETPEMGANPLLGFGRVYARPEVAKTVDGCVHRLLNDGSYNFDDFYRHIKRHGITIWGAAVDTLENTSRFAQGKETGPLTAIHLFDQPLTVARPYEAYMGTLAIPRAVVDAAQESSIHIDLLTPRQKLVEAIELAVPGIERRNIHVWTLRGKSREPRLSHLWAEWRELGVHLVDDGWVCPTGHTVFTDSGTYAPTYLVGTWRDPSGSPHLFLCDGYAASAEALQAASLSDVLDVDVSMALYSPTFELQHDQEYQLMRLDPDDAEIGAKLGRLFGKTAATEEQVRHYQEVLREARLANLPAGQRMLRADDFFPEKKWRVLAATGYMCPDPYTDAPGVTQLSADTYQVTTRLATRHTTAKITFAFRLMESLEQSRLVFLPLLERFTSGEDYTSRPVRISDSGRIRNELQTLASQGLEYRGHRIAVHFDRIDDKVILPEKKRAIRKVLEWYKQHHPVWFDWLLIE
jgi:hypothetical protein